MAYKVIARFDDRTDGFRTYEVGDTYPRKGYKPTEGRIEELTTANNQAKRGPFIAEAKENKKEGGDK